MRMTRLKRNIVVSTIIVIFFISIASAIRPPVKYHGFLLIDGEKAPDGVEIRVFGECFGEGMQEIVSTKTDFGHGYYVIDIPIDYLETEEDEGCDEGEIVYFQVASDPRRSPVELSFSGASVSMDIEFTSDKKEEVAPQPSAGSTSGGGGGGAFMPSEADDEPVNIVMLPPVKYSGFVTVGGEVSDNGLLIAFLGDCFGRGEEIVASGYTDFGHGYYTFDVPMDTPATEVDEGCEKGQVLSIQTGNKIIDDVINLASSGTTNRYNIELEEEPELQEPMAEDESMRADFIWKTNEGKRFGDNLFYIFTVLFMVSLVFLLYTISHYFEK